MDEGTTAIAEELVTPAIETQKPGPQPNVLELDDDFKGEPDDDDEFLPASEEEGNETTEEGDQSPPVEMIEVERNGKKYSIPKELEAELLMQADYTRKTQEVAETRKAVEAQREQAAALFQSSQQYIEAKAAQFNIEQQLKQYEGVNWNNFDPTDPMAELEMGRHWRQYQALQQQHQQVAQYLHAEDRQRTERTEHEIANRLQETRRFAEKEIPGWSEELDKKIVNFAVAELGFPIEQIRASVNPSIYKTLFLAQLGSQALQKQSAAPKPVSAPVKPLTTVSAKSTPSARKTPEQMTEAEYSAWFKQRQAKRG